MGIIVKTNIDEIDIQEWSIFVAAHSKGSVFQTPQMYRCYEQTPRQIPFIFAAYHNSKLAGLLVAVKLWEKGFLKSRFSARSIVLSGPVVENDDVRILESLLRKYDAMVGRQVIFTQIRNQFEQLSNCDVFRTAGYHFEPHLNYLIRLDSAENIWNRIGNGRKKQIKKAQKNGLYVDVYCSGDGELTPQLLHEGFEVIREVYRRAGLPLVDYSQIEAANEEGVLRMFVVRTKDGQLAGCRFGLSFGKSLYGWYAGSHSRFYSLFPNDILIWETLRWASANGYDVFDYGGAGSPNKPYGVRSFKSQMGGELVDFGRWEKVHKPLKMYIGRQGYAIYRYFKKVTNKLSR